MDSEAVLPVLARYGVYAPNLDSIRIQYRNTLSFLRLFERTTTDDFVPVAGRSGSHRPHRCRSLEPDCVRDQPDGQCRRCGDAGARGVEFDQCPAFQHAGCGNRTARLHPHLAEKPILILTTRPRFERAGSESSQTPCGRPAITERDVSLLQELSARKMAELARTIELRRAEGVVSAVALVNTTREKT